MSIRLMAAILDGKQHIKKSTHVLTLLSLADHANDEGLSCHPALPRLAKRTRKSASTISGVLDLLEAAHEIVIKREKGKVNQYGLVVPPFTRSYEDMCKYMNVDPVVLVKLKVDKRGGNKQREKAKLLPNSVGVDQKDNPHRIPNPPPPNSAVVPPPNSWDEPSLNHHESPDSPAAAATQGGAFLQDADGAPQPEQPNAVDPQQLSLVPESTADNPDDSPEEKAQSSATLRGASPLDATQGGASLQDAPRAVERPRDECWELICLGSFGKHYSQIGAQSGRVGKIKKLLLKARPDLQPAELEAAYKHYAKENPDVLRTPSKRLKSADTILDWIQQAIDAGLVKRSDDDIRASERWTAHAAEYEAYSKAFPDKTAQEIIDENFVGIQSYLQMHGETA